MRRVRTNGDIRWKGGRVFLSEALVGEPVGLKQISERLWAINYGPLEIGLLDETTMKTIKTPVKVLPMSPAAQGWVEPPIPLSLQQRPRNTPTLLTPSLSGRGLG